MASARPSNTFHCMLQTRVNWLINTYISHATSSIPAEILPSVSKVAGFGEACFGVLKVSCCGVASWVLTKFGDKRVNDLDLLSG